MTGKVLLISFCGLIAAAVGYYSISHFVPENNSGEYLENTSEVLKEDSKSDIVKEVVLKDDRHTSKNKEQKVLSKLSKIAQYKLNENEKLRQLREHILNTDYQLIDLFDELRGNAPHLSENSLQELSFLAVEHCARKYPYETFEFLEDNESFVVSNFFKSEDDFKEPMYEALVTGVLKSEDSEMIKQVIEQSFFDDEFLLNLGGREAANFALKNRELLDDKEFRSISSLRIGSYKTLALDKLDKSYSYAMHWAKNFKDGSLEQAYAFSNIAVQQSMREGFLAYRKDWVVDLQPGFAKDRTTLGFALGASRYYKDRELETNLKSMFVKDNFQKEKALELIQNSTLPSEVKEELSRLNSL